MYSLTAPGHTEPRGVFLNKKEYSIKNHQQGEEQEGKVPEEQMDAIRQIGSLTLESDKKKSSIHCLTIVG